MDELNINPLVEIIEIFCLFSLKDLGTDCKLGGDMTDILIRRGYNRYFNKEGIYQTL